MKTSQQPSIKEYDESTDPDEHLGRFNNAALLHRYSDVVKCWVFLTILVGPAQKWFDLLEPRSVRSFLEFNTIFLNQYATSKRYLKTSLGLFNMKQNNVETLESSSDALMALPWRCRQLLPLYKYCEGDNSSNPW